MNTDFKDIAPYSDQEAVVALKRVADAPVTAQFSKFIFPEESLEFLSDKLRSIKDINDFQANVMDKAIDSVLAKTSKGFSSSGTEYLKRLGHTFLAITNHRDITLDPALIQHMLLSVGLPLSEICVGNNLLSNQVVEDIMPANRMVIVKRNVGPRELFENSKVLSSYIRSNVTGNVRSVWIAQREGRAKNGRDRTEQGVLKMFDMSGEGEFFDNFAELHIVPMAISYEYEPCDYLKAREKVIAAKIEKYVKKPGEDLNSILTGITQYKGRIFLEVAKPITRKELDGAAALKGNGRYKKLCEIIDDRIRGAYHIWNTNLIAFDILNECSRFIDVYTKQEKADFEAYIQRQLALVTDVDDREALRRQFLQIYANPVVF